MGCYGFVDRMITLKILQRWKVSARGSENDKTLELYVPQNGVTSPCSNTSLVFPRCILFEQHHSFRDTEKEIFFPVIRQNWCFFHGSLEFAQSKSVIYLFHMSVFQVFKKNYHLPFCFLSHSCINIQKFIYTS